jgi:AraC family transcriptional activator of tynA and feaB
MSLTWSTLGTVPSRQFAHWRELVCEALLDLTPESPLRDGFVGMVTQWPLDALNLARIDSQCQTVRRTERDVARSPRRGYYANLQLRGTSLMHQDGRTAVLRPGDLALVHADRTFRFEFGGDFRQLSLYVPGALIESAASAPPHTAVRVDTATGVGAAVRHALLALSRPGLGTAAAARLAVLTGGMLAVIGETTVAAGPASPRSYRAVVADIEEHLGDDDLAPASSARRLGVSVRWLHRQFVGRERSYAGTVRRMRLERALRALRDPALGHLRVIDVAAEAGFGDVSSFHRAFRREFGRTPAEVRRETIPDAFRAGTPAPDAVAAGRDLPSAAGRRESEVLSAGEPGADACSTGRPGSGRGC